MGVRALSLIFVFTLSSLGSAQLPSEIHAEHRSGQTFLTWREIAATSKKYRVYRAESPITSTTDLASTDFLGEVDDKSSRNQGRSLATGQEHMWIVVEGGAELAVNQGLFVHTAAVASSSAYYAVTSVQSGKETKTIQPGVNATQAPLVEVPATPVPVLQSSSATAQVFGHWVGNRDTPFQPALSPWPSSGYNFDFEPGSGPAPRGLVLRLHAAGQSYAVGWPHRFEVPKDLDILAPNDLQANTNFSLWYGAHEKFPAAAAANEHVWNYTQERVLRELDWMVARLGATHDPERVYVIGGSLGAIGGMYLIGETPERFAAALLRNGLYDVLATDYKNPPLIQKILGSFALNLPTRAGIPIVSRTNAVFMAQRDPAQEWPMIRTLSGRKDETVGWSSAVELFHGLAVSERPAVHYFDERTHNPNGFWKGVEKTLLERTFQTRRDRPCLRFLDCTLDDDPGTGARTDGDLVGTINGYLEYDPLTATASAGALDFDVFLHPSGTLDAAPQPNALAALVPRRTGAFHPIPGEAVRFELREGSTLVEQELLYADADGRVRTRLVPLVLAHRHAHFERLGAAGAPVVHEQEGVAGATLLPRATYGLGDLRAPEDVDAWQVSAQAGELLALEVLAERFDPAGWQAGGAAPLLRVLTGDGTQELLRQDPAAWPLAPLDLELPRWRVPAEGDYRIELSTEGRGGGGYALRVQTLASEPVVLEQESLPPDEVLGPITDDTPATAQPLVAETTIAGHAELEAPDWYSFELAEDSLVSIELWMERLGLPAQATLYPAAELELASAGGSLVFTGQQLGDPCANLLRPAGTYWVAVHALTGPGDYELRLHVRPATGVEESEPDDLPEQAMPLVRGGAVVGLGDGVGLGSSDCFSLAGQAGERLELELTDLLRTDAQPFDLGLLDPDGLALDVEQTPWLGRVGARLERSGTHVLTLRAAGTFLLRWATSVDALEEHEPDDAPAVASPLGAGRAAGRIDASGDRDLFAFGAPANRLTRVRLFGGRGSAADSGFGSRLRPRLAILDAHGVELASVSAPGDPLALRAQGMVDGSAWLTLGFVPAVGGTYLVAVEDLDGGSGPGYSYSLEVQ